MTIRHVTNSTTEKNTVTVPTTDFTASVTSDKAPLKVLFTSNCTGNPTEFNWTFGDGIYSMQNLKVTHTIHSPEYTTCH
jgi:PKD repeat protein